LAEAGFKVYLVDSSPAIGGTMAALDKTFPTNDCSMCIMSPKLVECGRHRNIEIITLADVKSCEGEPGRFKVSVEQLPRFVDAEKCTGCGLCVANCPVRNTPHFEQKSYSPPDLTDEERKKIDAILEPHRKNGGSIISILQEIHDTYNYLPEDILKHVALSMDIPPSRIYNIVTFYKAFSLKPRGEHIITVCMGTACHVRGAHRILEELERVLGIKAGETSEDRQFTLETVACLGACALGPIVVSNGEYKGNMTIAKSAKLISTFKQMEERATNE
ncbi:MAG: NAD(P)H-dependent oxidoreductase subunit E, partial [Candidatus Aminicenantes bacterium]|nr:NAD(P)H-dependent oxidoreductase subunit E [Candidatus Aminicenantes bacterium]